MSRPRTLQDGSIPRGAALGHQLQRVRPLPATLLLVCTSVGAVVVIGALTFALVPVLVGLGLLTALVVAAVLMGWAGLEALAALERWIERDPRFKQ